jgi:uncharacterized protein (TIGR02145 family)
MKKALLLLLTAFSFQLIQAQVGIGTKTPDPSAMLEVKATNRGVLIPRLTLIQRNAIKSPANSLLIYQTDNTPGYYYFASGVWTRLATGTGSGSGPSYTFGSPLLLTGTDVTIPQAGASSNGFLSSVDWTTFNNKLSTASAASTYAPIASPTFTGTVSGITKSMVGLGNVDNTSDLTKPISSLTQAALDGKASLSSPGFSGTPTAPTPTVGNNSIQIATTAFVNAAISTISTPDADASTKGKIQLAGDLSGTAAQPTIAAGAVTSSKIADGSITDSKVASGISKSKVGLDQVDNTSDLNKPISTATQLAFDGKVSSNAAITAGTKTKVSYDSKGLVTAGEDATTSDIAEGNNLYFTGQRVRETKLTGLVSGTNTSITAEDDIAGAFSKVQAQLDSKKNMEPGSNTGDMLYWDGQKWVVVPAGQDDENLVFCDGKPSWGGCPATISTNSVTSITAITAVCGGTIVKSGGSSAIDRGFVWSLTPNPTIDLSTKLSLGSGSGNFTGTITNLEIATRYYVRAYLINPKGLSYGEEVSFVTAGDGDANAKVTDIDGNVYSTIIIGNQLWMKENLKTTKFNNGDIIEYWSSNTNRGYAWLNGYEGNKDKYGLIYNFYTTVDTRNVCPTGWHVPTESDWTTLFNTLGGIAVAGDKMKDNSSLLWTNISSTATNSSGFSALPGGNRICNGGFIPEGNEAQFASTRIDPVGATFITTIRSGSPSALFSWHYDCNGAYVRCVRN